MKRLDTLQYQIHDLNTQLSLSVLPLSPQASQLGAVVPPMMLHAMRKLLMGSWTDIHATTYMVSRGSSLGKFSVCVSKVGMSDRFLKDIIKIHRPSHVSHWSVLWGRGYYLDTGTMTWKPSGQGCRDFAWKRLSSDTPATPTWKITRPASGEPPNNDVSISPDNLDASPIAPAVTVKSDNNDLVLLVREYINSNLANRVKWQEHLRKEYIPGKTPVNRVPRSITINFLADIGMYFSDKAPPAVIGNNDTTIQKKLC